jgi:hypothetical protein
MHTSVNVVLFFCVAFFSTNLFAQIQLLPPRDNKECKVLVLRNDTEVPSEEEMDIFLPIRIFEKTKKGVMNQETCKIRWKNPHKKQQATLGNSASFWG